MYGYGCFISANGRPASGGIDADAQNFFTATGITNLTQKNAINKLVLDLKSANIWNKMKALYPIVGGNATAHSYNLKNTAQYQLSFSSGWTHSSTGMTPSNAYANTSLNPVTHLTNYNTHASIYCRLDGGNSGFDLGVTNYPSYNSEYLLASRRIGYMNGGFYDYGGGGGSNTQATSTTAKGLTLNSATSTTLQKLYKNGSATNTNTQTNTSTPPSFPIYIGAVNSSNLTAVEYNSNEYALVSIGDGLSDAEQSSFYTIVQNFQTTLSRQV